MPCEICAPGTLPTAMNEPETARDEEIVFVGCFFSALWSLFPKIRCQKLTNQFKMSKRIANYYICYFGQ